MAGQHDDSAGAAAGAAGRVVVYTIGHGRHEMGEFLRLLALHQVQALADVRSQPYSRWAPQFNREALKLAVTAAGVGYHAMGDCLGGRPEDPALYANGSAGRDRQERPDYRLMAASASFASGIEALLALARRQRLAIMCSESDYRECHRHLLLAPALRRRGVRVLHVCPDGGLVEEGAAPTQPSLFD